MQRRQFLKSSCNFCLLAGSGVLLAELASCSPAYAVIKTEVVNNQIQIPVAGFAQSSLQFVRPKGWYYDIAVQKKDNDNYEALLLQCTHQSNQLTPNGHGYTCNLHGSQFNNDGAVTKGPAEKSLKKYPVAIEHENLIINLKQS
ncbi:MAG TPA: Rieske (2Fe-2S) protein [Puia sp.]|nr:Rieske (2Fe-2S) protein [Puia sp.]